MRQPHDNQQHNSRQLRRPMGGDEDLARGMQRMDPFAYGGGGQFSGNNGGNQGRYGMQNRFDPPRPAPNAEGWSSGDDYLAWNDQNQDVQQGFGSGQGPNSGQQSTNNQFRTPAQSRLQYNQQHYQQRQQQQWNQAAQQAPWSIAASEFVPKSNLSVQAEEFVPRAMPGNTSQWAYQQQQQQQQQQHQQQHNPHHHPQTSQPEFSTRRQFGGGGGGGGYQPQHNPYQDRGGYGGGSQNSHQYEGGSGGGGNNQSHYDPSEVLSDAIATVVFMPSKFERTTMHLAEKFNTQIEDAAAMSSLVDSLTEQCFNEEQFLSLAGRFFSYLAQNVKVVTDGVTLRSLLLQKLEAITAQCEGMLIRNEKRVHIILTIVVDMYLHLVSTPAQPWKVHDPSLAVIIFSLLTTLFTNGSQTNVAIAAQKLKLCGKTLEGEEKFSNFADGSQINEETSWSESSAPKMDALIGLMATASSHSGLSQDVQKNIKALIDTRTNERWATAEVENAKAREDAAKILAKPVPRKSAAIRIEPDPNDMRTRVVVETKPNAPSVMLAPGQSNDLTEEELKFMGDCLGGEDNGSELDNEDLEESDGGMTEDIADAYEQFLAEQSKNGNPT